MWVCQKGVETQVILLLPLGDLAEDHSQVNSISPVLVKADIPAASLPPASFYTVHQEYRKLQFFSGWIPTPAGKNEFESWIDNAIQAVEEKSVLKVVKRQRLSHSLRSPAAEVICSLQMGKQDCVAMDYNEALYAVYGRVEKLPDLMYKFKHNYQCKGERLSNYISKADLILHQIIMKKGIDPRDADKVVWN